MNEFWFPYTHTHTCMRTHLRVSQHLTCMRSENLTHFHCNAASQYCFSLLFFVVVGGIFECICVILEDFEYASKTTGKQKTAQGNIDSEQLEQLCFPTSFACF